MKVGILKAILNKYDDTTEINFANGNFCGRGDDLAASDISEENGELLIKPPYWEEVEL